jgi:hypothetical protein
VLPTPTGNGTVSLVVTEPPEPEPELEEAELAGVEPEPDAAVLFDDADPPEEPPQPARTSPAARAATAIAPAGRRDTAEFRFMLSYLDRD